MDFSRDELRLLNAAPATLARRRFLTVGGLSVFGGAVMAACGGPGDQGSIPVAGTNPTSTTSAERVVSDAVLLRTASSLESNAIDLYTTLLDDGLATGDLPDILETFRTHHEEHREEFVRLTRDLDAEPFEEPNPVVQVGVIDRALRLIAEDGNRPDDVMNLVWGIEELAAETYQLFVQQFSQPVFRGSVMSVGGIEGRHAAVMAGMLPTGLVIPAEAPPAGEATTTTVAGTTTTEVGGGPPAVLAPVYQVPGAYQPLTSVPITIGNVTINVDALGPNSYMYETPES